MKSKKAAISITMEKLTNIILIALAFLILLVVGGSIGIILLNSGSGTACTLNTLMMSISKIAGAQTWNPNCPVQRIEVSIGSVQQDTSAELTKYAADWPTGYDYMDYNLDKQVAIALKSSWNEVGFGSRDYFSEWWTFFRCTKDSSVATASSASGTRECKKEEQENIFTFLEAKPEHPSALTICMITHRIKFDPEIKKQIKKYESPRDIISVETWMRNNPVFPAIPSKYNKDPLTGKYSDMSYYEQMSLGNGAYTQEGSLFSPAYTYRLDKLYYVVYIEIVPHIVNSIIKTPLQWIKLVETDSVKPKNTVRLISSDELAKYCDKVVGYNGFDNSNVKTT